MRRLLLAAAAATLVQTAAAAPPSDTDRAALLKVAADLDATWDKGDPATVAAFYAEDGSLRMDGQTFTQGRDAIRRYFETTMARRPAGARHVTAVQNIDMLTGDLAFVDTHARIERERAPGEREVLADFHNQTVAVRDGATWRFRVVRSERMAAPKPAS
ncbi:MAG TPA: SgcJ/EcaC family oxidoreductase [Tahibacter sp.]|nr:SgcJ/EcaC family oxidoreductase [Tahibacter sp.]